MREFQARKICIRVTVLLGLPPWRERARVKKKFFVWHFFLLVPPFAPIFTPSFHGKVQRSLLYIDLMLYIWVVSSPFSPNPSVSLFFIYPLLFWPGFHSSHILPWDSRQASPFRASKVEVALEKSVWLGPGYKYFHTAVHSSSSAAASWMITPLYDSVRYPSSLPSPFPKKRPHWVLLFSFGFFYLNSSLIPYFYPHDNVSLGPS